MAAVKIRRPPLCSDAASDIPTTQWPLLIEERRSFCRNVFPEDCRMLLFFIDDGEKADWAGFNGRDEYVADGLGLDPEVVQVALRGLQISDPEKAQPYAKMVELGKHGGKRIKGQVRNTHLKGDGSIERTIARLKAKGMDELARRVQARELSANAAAIQAGFRKKPVRCCPNCGHKW